MSSEFESPESLNVKLFPHQIRSILDMENLEDNSFVECDDLSIKETKIGILADKTGSGKSFCVIGLLCRDKMFWDMEIPYVEESRYNKFGSLVNKRETNRFRKINTNLIVVDACILEQWKQYLSFTNLSVLVINNSKMISTLNIEDYDIVLCNTKFYNKVVGLNNNIVWKRLIYDEPGHTKISKMKKIKCGFIWLISATPFEILKMYRGTKKGFLKEDFLNEIFTNEDFIDLTEGIIIKQDDKIIDKSFILPTFIELYHDCFIPVYNIVNGLISKEIQDLIEKGNIPNVIEILGGEHTNNLIELIKNNMKKQIDTLLELLEHSSKSSSILEKISSLKNKLEQINLRYKDYVKQSCPICLETLKQPVLEYNCQNLFCGKCILKWLSKKDTCPLCVQKVCGENLISVEEIDNPLEILYKRKPTKEQVILNLVKEDKKKKFIIYSKYEESLKVIKTLFKENNIKFIDTKGSSETISNNILKYKNSKDVNVIFLNSKYNGAGLNLQETTDIIFYHNVNKDTKTQIIGRGQRVGANNNLIIHNLKV